MGGTVPAGAALDVRSQAAVLREQVPPGPSVLVGHSASCQVVVEAAARLPDVVGLVLVGPTTDPAADGWPRTIGRWLRAARHERWWEAGELAPQYRRTGFRWMLLAMHRLRRHRVDVVLPDLAREVLVVRGSRDRIAPEGWCARLAALASGSMTVIPRGGHMVPLTHPRAVADAIEEVRRRCA
jgi:pimeloyl-ACP methyl ester carboxylesterase